MFCLLLYTWYVLFCCLVTKSCPTLCDLMGCSPPEASVHGISQAEILEWVAISFSRGSSQPREPVYPASPALQADSLPLSHQGRWYPSAWHMKVKSGVAQLCLTLCDPMDCSLPGSSVHGIFQARVLSGLPFPSPGDLPNPEIEPRSPALQTGALPSEPGI